ncbi:hypothetical protein I3842_03G123400 [Carya illinoinensis]|uniref:Uncharacterized protein n=1 Tax=Carya illinoinensis TaxID=32201 RepID=A0A922JY92_CARIL|nr:hypothetical protein I3842_03G123400 [Carya illinoinensis]
MDSVIVLFLVLSAFFTASAQQMESNVSPGSYLMPGINSTWLSRSGLFAFGFYKQGNGYAVGIFLAGIPQKTVVWTANRDEPPVSSTATLIFTNNGTLVLQSTPEQTPIIIADSLGSTSAAMLDTGNFVLHNSDQQVVWQSFEHPTDSLLPGQPLLAGTELFSSMSETDHSTGIFRLKMQHDGNLVQYPVDTPDTRAYAYYASGTDGRGDNVTLNFSPDGHLYLLSATGANIRNLTDGGYPRKETIYLMRIDADGIFRLYSYEVKQNGNWSNVWSSSNDLCEPKGLCGLNGYCVLNDNKAQCVCLPGFEMAHQTTGCVRSFNAAGRCSSKDEYNPHTMSELANIVWEDMPYSVLSFPLKEDCERSCLEDCNCEAALFKDSTCRKQRPPLRYGRRTLTDSTAFIKLPFNGDVELNNDVALRPFTYLDLEKATDGFREEVGKGSFGTVYKGAIWKGQKIVAVKKLEKVLAEGERVFQTEMKVIGRTHHRNQVQKQPCCEERMGIARDIARGILYLHEECEWQIIHCDMKLQNILLDDYECAKISDFGLAKLLN